MASFNYEEARTDAEEIINDYGQAGQFIKKGTTGGYDERMNPLPDQPDIVINGIVTPLLPLSKDEAERSGSSIVDGDKMCFFHSDNAPEIGYQNTQNGVTWRMVSVLKEIASIDGVNVFRKFQMRK